jgi:RimJ/RimL family protein N-acetyltransferase
VTVVLRFEPLNWPDDAPAVVEFLVANEWPFHGVPHLSPASAARLSVAADDVASFWIREQGDAIGLVRLMDLADLDDGSPLFDLRIAEGHRRRGIGRRAVIWLTDHLFTTYPALHRIEATTSDDNLAMRAVFAHCGYRLEGRFVEAWMNADGTRSDALAFAILRREYLGSLLPSVRRTC